VAVYGPLELRSPFLAALGRRGIDGGDLADALLPARRMVLLGDEKDTLAFYQRHRAQLRDRVVVLPSAALRPQDLADPHLRLFSREETAARLYWREHPLFPEARDHQFRPAVALIGFGPLGQALLTQGLQVNLFDPSQGIAYHIFGDPVAMREFAAVHAGLKQMEDQVIFHDEPWFDQINLLEGAVRVLVTEPDTPRLVQRLLLAAKSCPVVGFTSGDGCLALLSGQERLSVFDPDALLTPENVLGDTLYDRAMRLNHRYAIRYGGAADTPAAREEAWRQLNGFTRYSNISAADAHEVRLRMLETLREPADPDKMSPALFERLSELEHMRWCRYHWLNNWTAGTPADGAAKDARARIHIDLVPYAQLSDAEKEKDRESLRVLFET